LFALITVLFYLYHTQHYATRQLGVFVIQIITAAVALLLWYTVTLDASAIQPLVSALQNWWMKIQVSANFIGYQVVVHTFSGAPLAIFPTYTR